MPSLITRDIEVSVEARFLREHSAAGEFAFAYEVTVLNRGDEAVQLLRRHWVITDGMGHVREVEGAGVVGEQPIIEPGQSFTYNSWATLPTPVGTMRGAYQMVSSVGGIFETAIPEFILNADQMVH